MLEFSLIDINKASESQTYCDELKGKVESYGLEITDLSTHLQGQLVAVNPAYDTLFDGFAPASVWKNPKARTEWAIDFEKKIGYSKWKTRIKNSCNVFRCINVAHCLPVAAAP